MAASLPAFNGDSAAAAIDVMGAGGTGKRPSDRAWPQFSARRLSTPTIYSKAESDEGSAHVAARLGHYMPAALVASRFVALEPPEAENEVITMPFPANLSHALRRSPRA